MREGESRRMSLGGYRVLLAALLVSAAFAGCVGQEDTSGGEDLEEACDTCDQPPTDGSDSQNGSSEPEGAKAAPEPAQGNATVEAEDDGGSPEIVTDSSRFSIHGYRTPTGQTGCMEACDNRHRFEVTANATGMVLEAAWGQEVNMRMRVLVPETHCEPGPGGLFLQCPDPEPVSGESPLRFELDDPELLAMEGNWAVRVWVDSPVPQTAEGTLWSAVAYGASMPDGFTQVPP